MCRVVRDVVHRRMVLRLVRHRVVHVRLVVMDGIGRRRGGGRRNERHGRQDQTEQRIQGHAGGCHGSSSGQDALRDEAQAVVEKASLID